MGPAHRSAESRRSPGPGRKGKGSVQAGTRSPLVYPANQAARPKGQPHGSPQTSLLAEIIGHSSVAAWGMPAGRGVLGWGGHIPCSFSSQWDGASEYHLGSCTPSETVQGRGLAWLPCPAAPREEVLGQRAPRPCHSRRSGERSHSG